MTTTERAPSMFTINPKKAASYRLHAARWGVGRIAKKMRNEGYALQVALEVLAGVNARSF